MPRTTPDEDVKPFEYRPGLGFQRFRGMNRSADPASIPPDQFHLLTNVRLTPAGMISRDGLVEEEDTGSTQCITGMIDFDDIGVGLWLFEAFNDDDLLAKLANLNEQASPDYVLHWRSTGFDPVQAEKDQWWRNDQGWEALIRFRKKLVAIGTWGTPSEPDESATLQKMALFEVQLPNGENEDVHDRWLANLTEDNSGDPVTPSSMVTRMDRADETTDDGVLRETLYVGTQEGKIFSYDGVSVREELDLGTAYRLRLVVHNGIGIFAIGSDGSAAVARYQAGPGGSWDTVTLPDANMGITDLISWGGKVYVCGVDTAGTPTRGARIYAYTGGASLGAHVFEFPFVSMQNGDPKAGTFFSYRGSLYAISVHYSGAGPILDWYIWRRDNDSSWTSRFSVRNESDFTSFLTWLVVTGNRVIFGGKDADIGHAVVEVQMSNGNLTYLHQSTGEFYESITTQAFIQSPDDFSMDEEEE
jgi:hypothetical protein